jgi:glycosyltransferase involved in cell wall biosynthesis
MSRIILTHPTGNANCRAVLNGLRECSMLAAFYTSVASFPGSIYSVFSKLPFGRELKRREFSTQLRNLTRQRPAREMGRMIAAKAGITSLTRHETGLFSVDSVYRDLDRTVAKRLRSISVHGVYSYEDGALETFRTAKTLGVRCLYDLPIGYWRTARRLLEGERERWPEWQATLSGFRDSTEKLARKDEELKLADDIFVASTFTKKTLSDYPGKLAPIHVIPYGFPTAVEQRDCADMGKRKLKLLFVGGLSQRKGIADVFAVADSLKDDVELTVVKECEVLSNALKKHKWIQSLPHAKVLELMRQHDILLFPSLFEGFGLVITEAMSQGTPVITTERTVGPDLIENGKNGWLIEAGSTTALQRQVEDILNNRDSIASVGENARQSALLRPWSMYGQELANKVSRCLKIESDI